MKWLNLPQATKNLLIINVLIFLAGILIPGMEQSLYKWAALHYFSSPGFNVAQLFTYMFLHGNFTHLFFNMFALVMFGKIIEQVMGSSRFLIFYISCGIFAALCQLGINAIQVHQAAQMYSPQEYDYIVREGWNNIINNYQFVDPYAAHLNNLVNGATVGASGAIYGILLAFGMFFPNQPIYLYMLFPIKAKWLVIGYGVIELLSGMSTNGDGVAHFAHLGGMIAGLILILYWRKKGFFRNRWFF